MQPLFAHDVHSSLKPLPPLNGLEAPSSLLSHDPNFSFISKIVKFIKVLSLSSDNSILKKKNHFIYLFLAVLSLHCCQSFSLVTAIRDYSLIVVRRLFTAVASLAAEHGL